MKRWKWAAYGVGGTALLVGGAAVAVRVFLPPAKVKALALKNIGEALGREVRLAEASVQLSGVRLTGLEVSEVPDFKAGKVLKAKSVTATPRWWPLLTKREVLVGAVTVDSPEIWLSPAPARPAKAPAPASPASAGAGAGAAAFAVSSLKVQGGALTYKGAKDGLTATLKGLALDAKDVRLDGPVPFSLAFDYVTRSGGTSHSGRVEVQGKLDPAGGNLAKASLTVEPLSLSFDGLKARASGKVSDFSAPKADLELSLPRLDRSQSAALAAAPEGFALPALSGPLKTKSTAKGLEVEALELKGDGASLSLRAAQDGARWKVASLAAVWGAVRLSVSGSADTGAKGGTTVDLKAGLAPMSLAEAAKLVPGGSAYEPAGTFAADLTAKGPAASPALSGEVTLKGAAFLYEKQKVEKLDGKLTLSPDSAAGTLKGRLNDSAFEAKLDGKDLRKAPRVRLDARLEKLDLSHLPAAKGKKGGEKGGEAPASPAPADPAAKPFHVQGTLAVGAVKHPNFEASESRVTVDLKGRGSDPARMEGSVALRVGPGRFEDMSLLAAEKPFVKALLLPVVVLQKAASFVKLPLFPRFDTVTFSGIRGDYALKDGVLTVRESKLDGSSADAELSGTADLVKETLDMRAKVKIGGQGTLRMGGTVGFKIKGKMTAPDVAMDPASILKQPAVEKAVDQTLKQGAELLKGLFK